MVSGIATKNASNLMTRLALQQQYAQVLAAMQNSLSLNNWQSNPQMTASVRAQALAAHAEYQRQYAFAMMRGDLNQAQVIRARFLSQQAAAFAALPSVPVAPHPNVCLSFSLWRFFLVYIGTIGTILSVSVVSYLLPSTGRNSCSFRKSYIIIIL